MTPTPGEIVVCAVRAQTLCDAIRQAVAMRDAYPLALAHALQRGGTIDDPTPRHVDRIIWEAQRLSSACDRALGTRNR